MIATHVRCRGLGFPTSSIAESMLEVIVGEMSLAGRRGWGSSGVAVYLWSSRPTFTTARMVPCQYLDQPAIIARYQPSVHGATGFFNPVHAYSPKYLRLSL